MSTVFLTDSLLSNTQASKLGKIMTDAQPLKFYNPYHPVMVLAIFLLIYRGLPALLAQQSLFDIGLAIPLVLIAVLHGLCLKSKLSLKALLGLSEPVSQFKSMIILLVLAAGMLIGFSQFIGIFHIPTADPTQFVPKTPEGLSVISLAILPAISEELAFRGYLQSVVTYWKPSPPVWGILLTTLIFVSCHGYYAQAPAAIIYVSLMGLLLSYWRYRSQSILPGILIHLLNNLMVINLAN